MLLTLSTSNFTISNATNHLPSSWSMWDLEVQCCSMFSHLSLHPNPTFQKMFADQWNKGKISFYKKRE